MNIHRLDGTLWLAASCNIMVMRAVRLVKVRVLCRTSCEFYCSCDEALLSLMSSLTAYLKSLSWGKILSYDERIAALIHRGATPKFLGGRNPSFLPPPLPFTLPSPLLFPHLPFTSLVLEVKKVKEHIAVNGFPSHSYGTSLAIWDYTVTQCYLLPDTSERAPPLSSLGV